MVYEDAYTQISRVRLRKEVDQVSDLPEASVHSCEIRYLIVNSRRCTNDGVTVGMLMQQLTLKDVNIY
jgi:hypothetical protein